MKRLLSVALVALGLITSVESARGGLLDNLNPFAAKQTTPPKPARKRAAAPKSNPSMLSKIGSAPGNLLSKTKQMLTPAAKPAKKPTLGTPSGSPKFNRSGSCWSRAEHRLGIYRAKTARLELTEVRSPRCFFQSGGGDEQKRIPVMSNIMSRTLRGGGLALALAAAAILAAVLAGCASDQPSTDANRPRTVNDFVGQSRPLP